MSNLLRANFIRLRANKFFLLGLIFMILLGLYMPIPQYLQSLNSSLLLPELERVFFAYTLFNTVISSAFCSVFIGTEYSDNTMRNKICTGHTRTHIYLANLITCCLASLAMCFVFMIASFCMGMPLLGFFIKSPTIIVLTIIISLFLALALNAIFCLISMLCHNKTTSVIICIFLMIFMIMFGSFLSSSLSQEPTIAPYAVIENKIVQQPEQTNPYYIGGVQRQIYMFLYNFTPGGQISQILSGDKMDFLQLSAYSIIIFIIATSAGIYFFRKKDLN